MATGLGSLTLLTLFGGAMFGGEGLEATRAVELQYVRPTKADRQLELSNASWYFAKTAVMEDRLEIKLGATATRARGSITQLQGSVEDGTFRSEVLESSAWGLGPTAVASLRLSTLGATSIDVDASGSLMLYDRRFPNGGSRYNGMLQAGPSVSVALGNGRSLTAGVRWTHISNGQGLGAHNPSFDGRGLFVQYQRELSRTARMRS
jgi:Lipid A 3-O-deacylase (PagL)